MAKISPQMQQNLIQLQQLQQKMEILVTQRLQLDRELKETERALAELEPLDANALVYKTIGAILVKANRDKVKEELNDRKETLDMRIKTIMRQEERAKNDLEEKRKVVQAALQQSQVGGMGGGFPGPM
ncbi:MAG: prefoldin subunit beta [Candidatus Helarchaeota archaeon]|nr:prefoldin subunit beta [Candidatus Helarchaeota archaeon]